MLGAQSTAGGPPDAGSEAVQGCVRVSISPSFDPETNAAGKFIDRARKVFVALQERAAAAGEPAGMFSLYLSGYKPIEHDTIDEAQSKFPLMLGVTTAVVLFAIAVLLKSVFVPVRLLLTLIFPMAATFGLAVLIYQVRTLEHSYISKQVAASCCGNSDLCYSLFSTRVCFNIPFTDSQDGALNFLGIRNVSNSVGAFYWDIPVFAFIVLLGLALDYDVFIISRIIEYRVEGYTNEAAIVLGLYDTAPVITAAGLIMAITFCSLLIMDSGAVQQTGWLLVTSVLLDTFVVRSFIVPCVMSFADTIGWWPRFVPRDNLKDVDGNAGMLIEAPTHIKISKF